MKQKLLTLMMLLVMGVTGAWATDIVPSFVASNTANQAVKTNVAGFGDLYYASRSTTSTNTPTNHTNYRTTKGNFVFELASASKIDITFYSTSSGRSVKVGLYTVDETTFQVWQAAAVADPAVTMDAWLVAHKDDFAADGETTLDAYYIDKGFKTSSNHLTTGSDNQKNLMPESTSTADGLTNAGKNIYSKVYFPTDATSLTQNAQTVVHVNSGNTIPAGKYIMTIGDSGSNMGIEKITITSATPTLTGAWKVGGETVTSGTINIGETVPSLSLSVGATSGTPTSSDYTITYSKPSGDDVLEITGEGTGFTLKNNVIGTATLRATVTTTDDSKYLDAAETYDYTYTVNRVDNSNLAVTPATGTYLDKATVTMTFEEGYTVYYTTDGSDPETNPNSTRQAYSAPFDVTSTTTIKAIPYIAADGYGNVIERTYTIVNHHSWATVSAATTWDWEGNKSSLTTITIPEDGSTTYGISRSSEDINLADFDGQVYSDNAGFPVSFKADALLASKFQNPSSSSGYFMGTSLKFQTTVPGIITVDFSNTGSSARPYRYLYVNGEQTTFKSNGTTHVNATGIQVPAGTVTIKGVMDPDSEDSKAGTDQYLRIYKITFTPAVPVTITSAKYATFSSTQKLDFTDVEGLTAYKATTASSSSVTLGEVSGIVPAETGLLLYANVNTNTTYYVPVSTADATADLDGNLLQSTATAAHNVSADEVDKAYVFGKLGDEVGFFKAAEGKTIGVGKSYLLLTSPLSKDVEYLSLGFDEEEETNSIRSIENGEVRIENYDYYNLSGQRVGKDYKGIVIINGKKYVRK